MLDLRCDHSLGGLPPALVGGEIWVQSQSPWAPPLCWPLLGAPVQQGRLSMNMTKENMSSEVPGALIIGYQGKGDHI